jgi:tRNA (mo5U34)-methyltransferase
VSGCDFNSGACIGLSDDCDDLTRDHLQKTLMGLHPWRKGPFTLFGLTIDTEWRSDWKWQRLKPHLPSLQGKTVLDVGCGNGYHCLRLYGEGAERVIGVDPSAKFVHQFYAIKKYCPKVPVDVLPLGIEHIPPDLHAFDLVLSMGVIYHRRDPVEHVRELAGCLKSGGTLVLETLIIDNEAGESLIPEGRYAKMRNVWCIPTPSLAIKWLLEAGLENVQCVDLNTTTTEEQRSTPWMTFESLPDFLNPEDNSQTIEGHPAPRRGIFIATTP